MREIWLNSDRPFYVFHILNMNYYHLGDIIGSSNTRGMVLNLNGSVFSVLWLFKCVNLCFIDGFPVYCCGNVLVFIVIFWTINPSQCWNFVIFCDWLQIQLFVAVLSKPIKFISSHHQLQTKVRPLLFPEFTYEEDDQVLKLRKSNLRWTHITLCYYS